MTEMSAVDHLEEWIRNVGGPRHGPRCKDELHHIVYLALEAAKEIGMLEDAGWACCDGFGGSASPSCGCGGLRLYLINTESQGGR